MRPKVEGSSPFQSGVRRRTSEGRTGDRERRRYRSDTVYLPGQEARHTFEAVLATTILDSRRRPSHEVENGKNIRSLRVPERESPSSARRSIGQIRSARSSRDSPEPHL